MKEVERFQYGLGEYVQPCTAIHRTKRIEKRNKKEFGEYRMGDMKWIWQASL